MSEQDGTERKREFVLSRGDQNHIEAKISGEITVGFRLYAPDDAEYQRGIRAYVQYDVPTELGPLRGRNIRVVARRHDKALTVRWPQFPTGRKRAVRPGGELKPEFLDTIGPRDATSRRVWSERILAVYEQILEEARLGTLPTRARRGRRASSAATTLGQANPEAAAKLAAAVGEGPPDAEEQEAAADGPEE